MTQSAASRRDPVRIAEVRATAVREPRSGRTFVVTRVITESGMTGVGEAAVTSDPATIVAAVNRIGGGLAGVDALAAIPIDERLQQLAPQLPGVRAAINMAVLDILGQVAQAPLYQVLGGPTREKLRAMAVVSGNGEDELREQVRAARAAGYRAFLLPLLLPDGPTRGRAFYRSTRQFFDSLRHEHGEDSDFVLDCAARITAADGLSLAAAFEDYHLLWLDEPSEEASAEALAAISNGATTPVGYGRSFVDSARFLDLMREDGVDVLRPDTALSGITAVRKAASLAETYYLAVAPYNRGGPIGTAATLHASASLPNFFIQEVPFAGAAERTMRDSIAGIKLEAPRDGFFELPSGPGLGLNVTEEALREYEVKL